MKLISCHIENYGKLSDYDKSFDGGITDIFLENGEGKTTLASFIKAMFYGLPNTRVNDKEYGERRRYAPFGKGKFGGNIIFEKDGREYRVERSFDTKSSTKDTLTVYCNGSPTDELSRDTLGVVLFGLDEGSFARTLFMNASDLELSATEGISGKLNKYGDGDIDFRGALALLESAEKKYRAKQKNKGLIAESEARERELRGIIENLDKIDGELGRYYAERAELSAKQKQKQDELASAQKAELVAQKWSTYDGYIKREEREKEKIDGVLLNYPKGMPDGVSEAEDRLLEYNGIKEKLSVTAFSTAKQERLAELDGVFRNGEPSEDKLTDIDNELESIKSANILLKSKNQVETDDIEKALRTRFSAGAPSEAEISELERLSGEVNSKRAELVGLSAKTDYSAQDKKSTALPIALASVGALLAVFGGIAFTFSVGVAAVSVVLGLLTLIGGGFLYLSGRIGGVEKRTSVNTERAEALRTEIGKAEGELSARLSAYGYTAENGFSVAVEALKRDTQELMRIEKREKERLREISRLEGEKASSENKVREFIASYGLNTAIPEQAFASLKAMMGERQNLSAERDACVKTSEENKKKADALFAELEEFFLSYLDALPNDMRAELNRLKNDTTVLEEARKNMADAHKDAESYRAKEDLTERPEATFVDTNELRDEIEALRSDIYILDGQIGAAEKMTAEKADRKNELDRLLDDIAEYKARYAQIKKADELLTLADKSLTERYISPIKNRFFKYAEAVEKAFGYKVSLDKSFCVSFEKNGELHSYEHLSTGQRAVWALCLRLAFIDQLFDDDFPFMVLDDPFMALDASNMKGVAELVRTLSEERQLIYFYCHESRKINE